MSLSFLSKQNPLIDNIKRKISDTLVFGSVHLVLHHGVYVTC